MSLKSHHPPGRPAARLPWTLFSDSATQPACPGLGTASSPSAPSRGCLQHCLSEPPVSRVGQSSHHDLDLEHCAD